MKYCPCSFLCLMLLFCQCIVNSKEKNSEALNNNSNKISKVALPFIYKCDSASDLKYYSVKEFDFFKDRKPGSSQLVGELIFSEDKSGKKYFLLFEICDVMYPFIEVYTDKTLLEKIDLYNDSYCGSDEDFSNSEKVIIQANGKAMIVSETKRFKRNKAFEIIESTVSRSTDTLIKNVIVQ